MLQRLRTLDSSVPAVVHRLDATLGWIDRALRGTWRFLAHRYSFLGVLIAIICAWLLLRAIYGFVDPRSDAARADFLSTIAQIAGGTLLLAGLFFTARSLRASQEGLRLTEQGQVTERFTRAIDQLGATDKDGNRALELRLGAIYALERIARDSPRDVASITEILCAYIRTNAPRSQESLQFWASPVAITRPEEEPDEIKSEVVRPREDIQAAVNVLGKLPRQADPTSGQGFDFSYSDLRGLSINDLDLSHADLSFCDIRKAFVWGANLEHASLSQTIVDASDLSMARLAGARISGIALRGAHFSYGDLTNTMFFRCDLTEGTFSEMSMRGARFIGSTLIGASFQDADLTEVVFARADLTGAEFENVILDGADFTRVKGLEPGTLLGNKWNEQTTWPDGFVPPGDSAA